MKYNQPPEELETTTWDVIVIGTGMSGSVIGHQLAKHGKSVLFLEKGRSLLNGKDILKGDYAEKLIPVKKKDRQQHCLERTGRAVEAVTDVSQPKPRPFIPFIGSGTGGSTALYGAALERFFPSDFTPHTFYSHAPQSTVPSVWPLRYEDLLPYYKNAEELFQIQSDAQSGGAASLSSTGQEMRAFLKKKGLNPYRLPLAVDHEKNCPGCQGYLCDKDCKRTAVNTALKPALDRHGARLLDQCAVERLHATADAVTAAECIYQGQKRVFKARLFVLAAGALESPRLLLQSQSSLWPQGLANHSGLVGRNLMRHLIDLYIVFPRSKPDPLKNPKELAFNDFYVRGRHKFGTVQNFGRLVSPSMLIAEVEEKLKQSPYKILFPLFFCFKPLLKIIWGKCLLKGAVFASILEDLPYRGNRVYPDDNSGSKKGLSFSYRIHDFDKKRIALFRKNLKAVFSPYRTILVKQAENNERLAHACGTCRFGNDPRDSVLNKWNRAHDLSNLYVVDSSFFPTSAGTNPGLTLAANALRVADHILKEDRIWRTKSTATLPA